MTQFAIDLTQAISPSRDVSAPAEAVDARDGSTFADRLEDAAADQQAAPSEPAPDSQEAEEASTESDNTSAETANEIADTEQSEAPSEGEVDAEADEAEGDEVIAVAVVAPQAPVATEGADGEVEAEEGGVETAVAVTPAGDRAGPEGDQEGEQAPAELLVDAEAPNDQGAQSNTEQPAASSGDESDATIRTAVEATDEQAIAPVVTPPATGAARSQEGAEGALSASDIGDEVTPVANVLSSEAGTGGEEGAGDGSPAPERRDTRSVASDSSLAAAAASATDALEADAVSTAEQVEIEASPKAEPATPPASSPERNDNTSTLTRIAAGRVDAQNSTAEESSPRVDASRFVSRVTGAFKAAQERGGEVRLRLSPPELGVLQIKLTVSEGVLNASLETENAAARNALLDNLPALRERLAEQEIRIEKFDVDVRQEGGGDAEDWSPGERRDGRRQDSPASERGQEGRRETPSSEAAQSPAAEDGRINLVA